MVSRVYVEKKPGFDVEARQLERELKSKSKWKSADVAGRS